MTGIRLRDLMLTAGVMVLVVASISMQLSMASQMMKGARSPGTVATATE